KTQTRQTRTAQTRLLGAVVICGSSALNRGEENLDRINTIYRIMTDKIVLIVSILSIIGSIFRHLHVSTV
ncbi:MAG: hypothetical protein KDI02_26935, partial [Anaerolineae bacterium]|nr:hypothetical protein [Anaerolineae bacterium]